MSTLTIRPGRPLRGNVTVPGDKSISHRALLLGAIGEGATRAKGFLGSEDCLSTLECLVSMGAQVARPDETTIVVTGLGLRGLREPAGVLECGNSGTTVRLLSGILAGHGFYSVVTGDASLRRRPMARITEPLRRMGATILGRQGGSYLPLTIQGGHLRGMEYALPVASAQVKSCLLLAALYADGPTTLHEPAASRDHTERMLRAQGVELTAQDSHHPGGLDGRRAPRPPALTTSTGHTMTYTIRPPASSLRPLDLVIPGDISSAAFFLVAASLVPGSRICLGGVGVNPTRSGILDVLGAMGAMVTVENETVSGGEPMADLIVQAAELRGVDICGGIVPRLIDELPVIAVAATQAQGVTTVRDAAELRVKESDRVSALVGALRRLGARIEELPDGFVVEGPTLLRGAAVDSQGDHRLAMSLAIAGLVAQGETAIAGAESIAVSFPGFERTLMDLRAS